MIFLSVSYWLFVVEQWNTIEGEGFLHYPWEGYATELAVSEDGTVAVGVLATYGEASPDDYVTLPNHTTTIYPWTITGKNEAQVAFPSLPWQALPTFSGMPSPL